MLRPRRPLSVALLFGSFVVGCVDDPLTPDAALRDATADVAPLDVARSDVPTVDVPSVDIPTIDVPAVDTPIARDVPPATDVVVVDVAPPLDVPVDVPIDAPAVDVHADVPSDAPRPDPLAPLGDCLGTSAPLTVSRQMPFVSVPVGALRGEFVLDHGTTFSSIDLAAFPSPGPATSGCDPTRLGVTCTVDAFSFFAPASPVRLVTADFRGVAASVRQAGIVGTDFTSLRVLALSYATARLFVSNTTARCTDAAWRAAGFVALSSEGFFSHDLSTLNPMTVVDSSAAPAARVPNVPTVPVRLAGTVAVAQLDTGFDDALVPFSVNVNEAFYRTVSSGDPGALVRDAAHDLALTTCVVGLSESVDAYSIGPGRALEFVDDRGAVARRYPGATIFVKHTPTAARSCGGIGTWTAPAAQVAGSFFVDFGAVVFDPFSARVWVLPR